MEINDRLVHELFLNPELRKSDTRTVIFLLSNPGALSSDELSKGIGISGKSANKSIKRLVAAGIIQLGEPQAKKRTFIVQLSEPKEHQEVTERNKDASFDTLMDRFNRIEEMLGALMDTKEAGLFPAPLHGGQEVTGKVSHLSCVENNEPINGRNQTGTFFLSDTDEHLQDKKYLENIPIVTEPGTNEPQNDSIVSDLDTALLHAGARLAALKAASLLKEKQQQPCARTSIDDEFHALFGVQLPVGSDMAAVGVMISRKKAGKLDVKSPLAYLNSLSGKVTPILATPPPPALPSVTDNRLSHADIARIDSIWDAMDHSQYKEKAMAKDQTGKKYPVPVELLARSIFNAEMMAQGGIQ